MTSPPDARPRRTTAGFTLVEVLAVLAILGLCLGLVLARGPARSRGLEMRAATDTVAETLRRARARAIATHRDVAAIVVLTPPGIAVEGEAARPLPGFALAATGIADPGAGLVRIAFAPDGSSSGGAVELGDGARRRRVAVDWLSGRVGVADAP